MRKGAAPGVSNQFSFMACATSKFNAGLSPILLLHLLSCREAPAPRESQAYMGLGMISVTEAVLFDEVKSCNQEKGLRAAP